MTPDLLALFHQDEPTRNAVKEFQLAVLDEMVLEDCYNKGGENAKALQQTKRLIEKSFIRLDELFAKNDKPNITDPH